MPIDKKLQEDVERILGNPDLYPDDLLSWMLKKLTDNPFFTISEVQLPIAEPATGVGDTGAPAYVNDWTNYASGWQPLQYRKDPFGTVFVSGVIKNATSTPYNDTITTLPAGYRPETNQILTCFGKFGAVVGTVIRVDIMSNGDIIYREGPGVANPSATVDYLGINAAFKAFA